MSTQLSIVIPIYNEEENIEELNKRLFPALKETKVSYEVIFINDGSRDSSLKILKRIQRKNKYIRLISFSRNFGHMPAITAGLKNATGKKIVIMDADLQDPPELINQLYKKSLEGFNVVYGIKIKRKESIFRKWMFSLFYRLMNSISTYKMPLDSGTFSIIDRKVVDIICGLSERNKYFSGLRAWTGFKQTGIIYERGSRFSGNEATLARLFKLAIDGFISFSYLPLRLASFIGFGLAIISFVFIFLILLARIFFSIGIVGWVSTMSAILFIGGIQLITLGIIGEYLGRIYDEVKNRPEYIISEKLGFK